MVALTSSQQFAWELLQGEGPVFLTGEAGSGKSFLAHCFIETRNSRDFPILASTGAASVLVGGRTLHSFLGLGILKGGIEATVLKALKDRRVCRRIKKAKGLVIDEISMISGETFRAAEMICRLAREENRPWGGLKIIVVGDFAQLPPVERHRVGSPDWAFKSRIWAETGFQSAVLKQNVRSRNLEFLQVLNRVRRGQVDDSVRSFLRARSKELPKEFEGTRLFPRRVQADQYNECRLLKLPGKIRYFPTEYTGEKRYVTAMKKYSPLPEELKLIEGALVMLRQNDPCGRWINGSTGTLVGFGNEFLKIELLNGRSIEIEKATFSLLDAEGKVRAEVINYPVTLAWAATIHKSQGMTLDRLAVNLEGLWEPGHAYVALSRITEPDNLWLIGWQERSVKVDPQVAHFYQELESKG